MIDPVNSVSRNHELAGIMRTALVYILRHRTLFAFCAAVLWLVVNALIGLTVIVIQSRDDQRTTAAHAISRLDTIYREIDTVFDDLLASSDAPCSQEMILQMRRTMFLNNHVQDILYFRDGGTVPSCSANLGRLANAAPLPPPEPLEQTRFDRDVWFDMPIALFDGEIASYTVKQGRFAVTANMSEVRNLDISDRWETYVPDAAGNYVLHVDGDPDLHRDYENRAGSLFSSAFMHSECSDYVGACITLAKSISQLLQRYGPFAVFGGMLSLITSVMAYSVANRGLAAVASPQGRIRSAIARGKGFYCVYQPIVELASGRAVSCEVLARFEDELGALQPDQFIPIVVKLGKSWEFTEIILSLSLPALTPLTRTHPDFRVSVNFFPCDLENGLIPRLAASRPLNYAIENGIRLNCEILETGFADAALISETLRYLKDRDFTVAIDDFGTGTSNLKQIRSLNANIIKVDRSFVRGLNVENASIRSSLIPHIVDIAGEVGVEVIAEGVETAAQLQILESLDIRYGQGYFFSPPTGIRQLEAFVETAEAPAAAPGSTAVR